MSEQDKANTEAFVNEIEAVCRKHGLSISHEDSQGAFIIDYFDEHDIDSLRYAAGMEVRSIHDQRSILACKVYREMLYGG